MRIALANQKGGVGKTTTAVHLAAGLALAGHEIALFDLDPQGSSTLCLTQQYKTKPDKRSGDSGEHGVRWLEAWPAIETGEGVVVFRPGGGTSPRDLPQALASLPDGLAVLIDCPPSLEGWTPAAVGAADHTLVPLQCEFLSLQGLARIVRLIDRILGPSQRFHILPVMYEETKTLHREIVQEVAEHFPSALCRTVIPRDPSFPEAASHGCSLFRFRPRSRGCTAYANLIREITDEWT